MRVFLTGVTGFVGRYVAARLLSRPGCDTIDVLVRADSTERARDRLLESLRHVVTENEAEALVQRMEPVLGDLSLERFGLSEEAYFALAERTEAILHGAANVRFDQGLDEARAHNVRGTMEAVRLAREAQRRGGLRRFDWVGTAFVAGLRRDRVGEDELEHSAGWKNAYEQSKYEAELYLRREAGDLPVTVFRPSIVVGESGSGATTNFGMLYWPIRLYTKGWWRTVVGSAHTPVDIVPVDFVADAIEALTRPDAEVGGAYHLTAGPDGAVRIEELVQLVRDFFGGPPARYVDPAFFLRWVRPIVDLFLWGPRRRVLQQGGRFFIPYFAGNPLFANERAVRALATHGIKPPLVREYFTTILKYCQHTDFGRLSPPG